MPPPVALSLLCLMWALPVSLSPDPRVPQLPPCTLESFLSPHLSICLSASVGLLTHLTVPSLVTHPSFSCSCFKTDEVSRPVYQERRSQLPLPRPLPLPTHIPPHTAQRTGALAGWHPPLMSSPQLPSHSVIRAPPPIGAAPFQRVPPHICSPRRQPLL